MFYKQMLNSAGVVMTSVRGNLCPSQARRGDGRVSGRAGVPGPAVVEWKGGQPWSVIFVKCLDSSFPVRRVHESHSHYQGFVYLVLGSEP